VKLLLDTHVVLWLLDDPKALGARTREAATAAAELAFSVVSFAEIGLRVAIGKLVVPDDFHARVLESGVRILGLSAEHGLAVGRLPLHHRDPFDRLLVAQAQEGGYTLVTADRRIPAYDVAVLDPRT
jgi:PIN domain nuclease of toxin-antitoxin system